MKPADADTTTLVDGASRVKRTSDELSLTLPVEADLDAWLARAHTVGAKVVEVTPRHETLEDLFLRQVAAADAPADNTEARS